MAGETPTPTARTNDNNTATRDGRGRPEDSLSHGAKLPEAQMQEAREEIASARREAARASGQRDAAEMALTLAQERAETAEALVGRLTARLAEFDRPGRANDEHAKDLTRQNQTLKAEKRALLKQNDQCFKVIGELARRMDPAHPLTQTITGMLSGRQQRQNPEQHAQRRPHAATHDEAPPAHRPRMEDGPLDLSR